MKRLVIATKNEKKKKEVKKILKNIKMTVVCLADLNMHVPTIVEDGTTFRQNAIKKALTYSRYIKGLVLADDSGLEVKSLDGRPGVRSARFAHSKATDEENNKKLLQLMRSMPVKKRSATFVSYIAVADNGNLVGTAEGKCDGMIGLKSKGHNGFGYDPLFTPKGMKRTFAEFDPAFKNKISHRAKALKKAKEVIKKYL